MTLHIYFVLNAVCQGMRRADLSWASGKIVVSVSVSVWRSRIIFIAEIAINAASIERTFVRIWGSLDTERALRSEDAVITTL